MPTIDDWQVAPEQVVARRLDLEPLRVEHADEMAVVLGDPHLHGYIGGEPATVHELRSQYAWQSLGRSDDGAERWFNWVARCRRSSRPVGFVQATVWYSGDVLWAELAWVIGTADQGRGYATEAAGAMVDWLRAHGVEGFVAHVHPEHLASNAVARRVGLRPTDDSTDGEVRWVG